MRPHATSIAIALLLTGTACASGATPTTSTRSAGPIVRAGDRQNNKTITLRRGQRLQLTLHSTYWQVQSNPDHTVLQPLGKSRVRATTGCVAGGGCGTVTTLYLAAAPGTAVITADRNSCGEAMGCTGTAGRYTLHIRVVRR